MDRRIALLFQMGILLSLILIFSPPGHSEPINLGLARAEAIKYHDSGLYQQELTQKIQQAEEYIIQQAIANKNSAHPQKLALVLDIDETSLSNYDKMVQRDFVASQEVLHQEIQAADAPAIEPMLALYQKAIQNGIDVFFITGRKEYERDATLMNLNKAGYDHWTGIYFKPNDYSLSSVLPFKSGVRAQIIQNGYTIIASIGDQYSDVNGGNTLKGFKLPNPYYYLP